MFLCAVAGCSGGGKSDITLWRTTRLGDALPVEVGIEYWGARTRALDDGAKRLIFDLDAKTVTYVDKRAHTYIVRTLDEIQRKVDAQRKVRDPTGAQITLMPTNETERIAGHEARQYTFTTERAHGAVWLSNELRPVSAWRPWETLITYVEGGFALGIEVTDAVSKADGYPLRTALTFTDPHGSWTITTQVSDTGTTPAPPDIISVPEGFQRGTDFPLPDQANG
jgi:hypothetical protein